MPVLQTLAVPEPGRSADTALYLAPSHGESHPALTARSLALEPNDRASLLSFFNAFPAGYWQHWTNVREVRLTTETSGEGRVALWASDADGNPQLLDERAVTGDARSVFDISLAAYHNGGWLWLRLASGGASPLQLSSATWTTDAAPTRPGKLVLGMTTMDKPDFAVATLAAIAAYPALLAELDQVIVVDQGSRLVRDEPEFAEIEQRFGGLLRLIRQPNLGGSGGFARIMAEALDRPEASAVMLLDDDVEVEPEGILRALRFHRQTVSPVLVGGHMFDLRQRTVLHSFSERVDREAFSWEPRDRTHRRWDLASHPLSEANWMHRREDADFNGWFMCLIPTEVLRRVGLALPVFIKWDDAEYGLRAQAAGYPTVTLPGAALWHQSWLDKDDAINWQAYFHARNRIIAALLHSDRPRGGTLLQDSRKQDLKHLLSMQYYAVAARHRALRDVLNGPAGLHDRLGADFAELKALASGFPETATRPLSPESQPPADRESAGEAPHGLALAWATAIWVARQLFVPVRETPQMPDERVLAKSKATWWRLPLLDSALVATADGTGVNRYRRDPVLFRRCLRESIRLHRRLAHRWGELRAEYRAALPALVSPEAWQRHFTVPTETAPTARQEERST